MTHTVCKHQWTRVNIVATQQNAFTLSANTNANANAGEHQSWPCRYQNGSAAIMARIYCRCLLMTTLYLSVVFCYCLRCLTGILM